MYGRVIGTPLAMLVVTLIDWSDVLGEKGVRSISSANWAITGSLEGPYLTMNGVVRGVTKKCRFEVRLSLMVPT